MTNLALEDRCATVCTHSMLAMLLALVMSSDPVSLTLLRLGTLCRDYLCSVPACTAARQTIHSDIQSTSRW